MQPAIELASMNDDSPEAEAERLLQLSEEVIRIAGSLARLANGLGASLRQDYPCSNLDEFHVPLERVTWLIQTRRDRARYVAPELFGEPAWDILLDLLRAELAHERMSVSTACVAAGVPPSSGLRWLKALEHRGLVVGQCDVLDAGRTFVVLSPRASKALRRYFVEVVGTMRSD